MSPRTPTAVSSVVALYNSSFSYNAPIAYNASSMASPGSMSDRIIVTTSMDSKVSAASTMNAR